MGGGLYRKDRVRVRAGHHHLVERRLAPTAKTRRVIASCCGTPIFLEFERGHWLSLYAGLWPDAAPPPTLRTMASDLPPGQHLPDDLPNHRTQSAGFIFRLARAWIAMGFRAPPFSLGSPASPESPA